jgi:hypothetical protein
MGGVKPELELTTSIGRRQQRHHPRRARKITVSPIPDPLATVAAAMSSMTINNNNNNHGDLEGGGSERMIMDEDNNNNNLGDVEMTSSNNSRNMRPSYNKNRRRMPSVDDDNFSIMSHDSGTVRLFRDPGLVDLPDLKSQTKVAVPVTYFQMQTANNTTSTTNPQQNNNNNNNNHPLTSTHSA